jgi:Methylamine utilisation protein MauE
LTVPAADFADPGVVQDLSYAVQLAAGAVFVTSLVPKLRHPRRFAAIVADYELLPRRAAAALAWPVIALEGFLAVSFLTGWAMTVALVVGAGLVAAFVGATWINLMRGREIECGCFGATDERISQRSLVRQGLLLAALAALAAMVATAHASAVTPGWLDGRGGEVGGYLLSIAGASAALLALSAWVLDAQKLRELTARPPPRPQPPVPPLELTHVQEQP